MPLLATAFLASASVPLETLRSTPHPLPFGARSTTSLVVCACRHTQHPSVTTRVTHPFRMHPPRSALRPQRIELYGQSARRDRTLCWLYVQSDGATNYGRF